MDYFKGVLSVLAAIFIAEFAFLWPFLQPAKATGISVIGILLRDSLTSPKLWIVGLLAFCLFFAASRARSVLSVLFFWIPTVAVSTVGFVIVGFYTFLYFYMISKTPQIH